MLPNLVLDDKTLYGKELADTIHNAFTPVSQEMSPLKQTLQETNLDNEKYLIPLKYFPNEKRVYQKLTAISVTKYMGPDKIPNWVLRDYAYILALSVSSIINASLQQACVPTPWKKADVILIPKIPAPMDINNDLRPISLNPTLSKICKSFVVDWLIDSIDKKMMKDSSVHKKAPQPFIKPCAPFIKRNGYRKEYCNTFYPRFL